ncbi:MAG TPA: M13 family metallopeptidase N-terminal domain-containing protein, partial [Fodinibius sp.]|nr:M13 family metallopeptidase N-terminal domain-containing protein [Fodinibius sp.]
MKSYLSFFLVFGLLLVGLSGCDNESKKYNELAARQALDLSGRDTTVSPADSFFEYANGSWLENTEIPASKTGWGSFYVVRDKALQKMKTILDSVSRKDGLQKGSIEQQIAGLYKSAMDSMTVEKAGLKPLQESLDHIAAIQSSDDILPEVVREYKKGNGTLFSFHVGPDDKNSRIERVHLDQGGLGLPNRGYYRKDDSRSKSIRSAYKDYVTKILTLSGSKGGAVDEEASQVIDLETKLAKASKTPVELRDPEANYHLMTVNKLSGISPEIDWQQVVQQMELGVDTIQVGQPKFYKRVSALLESKPVNVWKDYLRYHLVSGYAPWLSSPFAEAHFNFYNKILNGQQQPEPRWKRASNL